MKIMKDKLKIKILDFWLEHQDKIGEIPSFLRNKVTEKDIINLMGEMEYNLSPSHVASYKRGLEKHYYESPRGKIKLIIITALITSIITGSIMGGIQWKATGLAIDNEKNISATKEASDKITIEFNQIRDKIDRYDKKISGWESCQNISNRTKLVIYRRLCNNAMDSWKNSNFGLASSYLENISLDIECIYPSAGSGGGIGSKENETSEESKGITGGVVVGLYSAKSVVYLWLIVGIIALLILILINYHIKEKKS